MHAIRPTVQAVIVLCTLAMLTLGGCPTGTFVLPEVPDEIKAVIAARDSVQIAEDDPALSVEPDRIVDDLSGLDGCWASYTSFSPPDGLPASLAETFRNDAYTYFRFDSAGGRMTNIIYGVVPAIPLATVATYEGTYAITEGSRLTFTVENFTTFDPSTGETWVWPDGMEELMRQTAANSEITEAELAESLATLAEPLVFDYRVTLEGDRVTLFSIWENDDGTEGSEEPQVCFRFACPD